MSRQFLATEATLFLSGGSSDGLQPRKVQVMPASDWLILTIITSHWLSGLTSSSLA